MHSLDPQVILFKCSIKKMDLARLLNAKRPVAKKPKVNKSKRLRPRKIPAKPEHAVVVDGSSEEEPVRDLSLVQTCM